jgi:hypothetical protein
MSNRLMSTIGHMRRVTPMGPQAYDFLPYGYMLPRERRAWLKAVQVHICMFVYVHTVNTDWYLYAASSVTHIATRQRVYSNCIACSLCILQLHSMYLM